MIDPILSCRFGYQTNMYKKPIKAYTPDKDEQDFISTLDHPLKRVKHIYQCGKQETKKRQGR